MLSIHNAQSQIDLAFILKGSQTRDPAARIGRPDMGVNDGETIEADITNNGERDLYVAILDLTNDGSITGRLSDGAGGRGGSQASQFDCPTVPCVCTKDCSLSYRCVEGLRQL